MPPPLPPSPLPKKRACGGACKTKVWKLNARCMRASSWAFSFAAARASDAAAAAAASVGSFRAYANRSKCMPNAAAHRAAAHVFVLLLLARFGCVRSALRNRLHKWCKLVRLSCMPRQRHARSTTRPNTKRACLVLSRLRLFLHKCARRRG